MNFLSWDNLSRILSGGVGVGSRVKAPKRHPSPKSSRQWSGQVLPRARTFLLWSIKTLQLSELGFKGLKDYWDFF